MSSRHARAFPIRQETAGIAEHVDAFGCRFFGPGGGPGFHAFFTFDAQADERSDLGAEFDGFLLGQVAEVLDL